MAQEDDLKALFRMFLFYIAEICESLIRSAVAVTMLLSALESKWELAPDVGNLRWHSP